MHRAHVVMLAGLTEAPVGDLEDHVRVDRVAERLPDALVVERLDRLHARGGGVGRRHRVHLHVRQLLQRVELHDVGGVETVHLLAGQGAHRRRRVVAEVDELDLIQVRPTAPVRFLAGLEDLASSHLALHQREGAGAVRADFELAVLGRIEDQERIVEELLGDGQLWRLAVEPDGEGVDLLDGVGVPQPRGFLGVALVVLLARLELLEEEALHEPDDRGARLGVEHALEVPHDVVRVELPAVVPLDVAAQLQRPGLEVGARLPLLDEARARDVVDAGDGQVVDHLARGVGRFDPGIRVRALEILAAHAEAQRAAAWEVLRGRRRHQRLAGDAAGERVGGGGRHSQEGRVAEELTAVDLPLDELTLEPGDQDVLVIVIHRRFLPARGGERRKVWAAPARLSTGPDRR